MALYTRRQLFVLLLLVAAGGAGLAVGHWRRANPDTVEYLEQLDRAPAPPPVASAPQPSVRARDARSAADREPRRTRRSRMPHGVPAAPPADTPTESSSVDDLDADRATETDSSSW